MRWWLLSIEFSRLEAVEPQGTYSFWRQHPVTLGKHARKSRASPTLKGGEKLGKKRMADGQLGRRRRATTARAKVMYRGRSVYSERQIRQSGGCSAGRPNFGTISVQVLSLHARRLGVYGTWCLCSVCSMYEVPTSGLVLGRFTQVPSQ